MAKCDLVCQQCTAIRLFVVALILFIGFIAALKGRVIKKGKKGRAIGRGKSKFSLRERISMTL